jgi:5-methyltetrahydrofolate--homocysteine methyltransferase
MTENQNGKREWENAVKTLMKKKYQKIRNVPGTTEWENVLADALKESRVRFRRQVQIGPYTVDFSISPKLVIEVDGSVHSLPWKSAKDKEKTAFLKSKGFRVWRVRNYEIRGGAAREVAENALRYQKLEKLRSKRPPK